MKQSSVEFENSFNSQTFFPVFSEVTSKPVMREWVIFNDPSQKIVSIDEWKSYKKWREKCSQEENTTKSNVSLSASQLGKKGSEASNVRHNIARTAARKIACNMWKENAHLTKSQVVEAIERIFIEKGIKNFNEHYSTDIIMGWIKSEVPQARKRGGRPKKPKLTK